MHCVELNIVSLNESDKNNLTSGYMNAPLHSAKLESGFAPGQSGFPRQYTSTRHHRTLTFTLDFKDAYRILRIERPDLTRRKRVPPLDPRRNRRWPLHYLDERLRASDGHPTTVHSLEPPRNQTFARLSRSAGPPLSDPARTEGVTVLVFIAWLYRQWFTGWFAFEYLLSMAEWRKVKRAQDTHCEPCNLL